MSKEKIVHSVQEALRGVGISEAVAAAGRFLPRGRTGPGFVALPKRLLVGVTSSHVYGFAADHDDRAAGVLVFSVARQRVEVRVRRRIGARVLELVDPATGSAIRMEGARGRRSHSKDVIDVLGGLNRLRSPGRHAAERRGRSAPRWLSRP